MPDSKLTLANFMRAQIYSAIATLKIGMDILTENENIDVDYILGHGGFFKTKNVGQQLMADALNIPRSEEHTSELQSRGHIVCRLLLEKKNPIHKTARMI